MAESAAREFTRTHSFVTGVILTTIGIVGLFGAISGNLATMLAALFEPTDIFTIDTSKINTFPGLPGNVPSGGGGGGGGAPALPPSSGTPSTPSIPANPAPSLPGVPELPVPGIGELPIVTA